MTFDKPPDRRNTHCVKWDAMEQLYGVPADTGISMWVADMDFATAPVVQDAVRTVFRTWRERGADGFRLDAVTSYLCDPDFRDNPPASPEERARMDGEQFLPYVRQNHLHDMLPGDIPAFDSHPDSLHRNVC